MLRSALFGILLVCPFGCSQESVDHTPSSDTDSAHIDATSLTVAGQAIEYRLGVPAVDGRLDGVEVCTGPNLMNCQATRDGRFEILGLTPHSQHVLRFSKPGYMPSIDEFTLGDSSQQRDAALIARHDVEEFAESANVALSADTGGVLVAAVLVGYGELVPLAGFSFQVSMPARGTTLYVDDDGTSLRDAAKTGTAGWGVSLGLPPGRVSIALSHELPELSCALMSAGAFEYSEHIVTNVVAGHITYVPMICVPGAS